MWRRDSRFSSVWLAASVLFGCSSSETPKPMEPPPAVCEAPGYHVASDPVTVDRVRARLVDPSGAPVPNLPVQVCGIDQCLNFAAQGSGQVDAAPRTQLELPAFKYGDGFDLAEFAISLDGRDQDLGTLLAVPLPPFAEGARFTNSGRITSGQVSLLLDAGTHIEHDMLTYSEDELVFRSVLVPEAPAGAADPNFGFDRVYGLAPLGSTFCPPARLSVANDASWEPLTEVEVFVQGLNTDERWAPYGSWLHVADARVSADGQRIDSVSGGIPVLSSIALRRK